MSETKTYPIGVALSVASGKFLCGDFSLVHEMVTDVAGWPVMTHHMASDELMGAVAARVIAQVQWMPGAIENMPDWSKWPDGHVQAAITAWLDRIAAEYGSTVTVDLGDPLPPLGLLAGLEHLGSPR